MVGGRALVRDHQVGFPDLAGRHLHHVDASPVTRGPLQAGVAPAHRQLALQGRDLGRVVHVFDVLDVEVGEDRVRLVVRGFYCVLFAQQGRD